VSSLVGAALSRRCVDSASYDNTGCESSFSKGIVGTGVAISVCAGEAGRRIAGREEEASGGNHHFDFFLPPSWECTQYGGGLHVHDGEHEGRQRRQE